MPEHRVKRFMVISEGCVSCCTTHMHERRDGEHGASPDGSSWRCRLALVKRLQPRDDLLSDRVRVVFL